MVKLCVNVAILKVSCLRACHYCLQNNFCSIRRAVLVITVDCESGNKQCLKQIQQELLDGTISLYLSLLSVLPDIPYVLKTCKVSFGNWYLQLNNERGCLSLFYTLRNRAIPEVRENVKTYLKSTEYLGNRNHQNQIDLLVICNPGLF